MNVGHGDGGSDDPGKVRHIHNLLHALIPLEIVHQFGIRENESVGPHSAGPRYPPAVGVELANFNPIHERTAKLA